MEMRSSQWGVCVSSTYCGRCITALDELLRDYICARQLQDDMVHEEVEPAGGLCVPRLLMARGSIQTFSCSATDNPPLTTHTSLESLDNSSIPQLAR